MVEHICNTAFYDIDIMFHLKQQDVEEHSLFSSAYINTSFQSICARKITWNYFHDYLQLFAVVSIMPPILSLHFCISEI